MLLANFYCEFFTLKVLLLEVANCTHEMVAITPVLMHCVSARAHVSTSKDTDTNDINV